MILDASIGQLIKDSTSRALATSRDNIPHLIPVSTLEIIDNKIILVNYFMKQSIENIAIHNKVSFLCWKAFEGFHIKGSATYQTEGEIFEHMKLWAQEHVPERTVYGVIVIDPEEIFDVSVK